MKLKKVNVLLSSYNGEKYIREQLRSLMEQEYENYQIHIRDDGSSDDTVGIIKEFMERYPGKIYLYQGENLGFRKSFQWLVRHCTDADYFAFCDQDDVWYPCKIARAVECLDKKSEHIPLIYLCDFYWCDVDMNRLRKNNGYKKRHSLEKYVTFGDRNAFGFTEVFNKKALEGMKDKKCFEDCGHDEITYLYCLCNGGVIWDDQVCVDYRRHGDNVSKQELVGGTKFTHFLWRVDRFLVHPDREGMYKRFMAFYKSFKSEMKEREKRIFRLYLGNRGKLRKALLRKRYRDTLADEISIRILFLLGKV